MESYSSPSLYQEFPNNNNKMNAAAALSATNKAKQRKPNELFVGDLSYFCTEAHLFDLFNQYGNVTGVRIVRNDQKKRSMNFGFVSMESPQMAREIAKVLNNHLFMGRVMKVEQSDYKASPTSLDTSPGFQVHVSFSASFVDPDSMVLPTEAFLRKAFIKFGTILDVVVREFNVNMNNRRHYGYAFVAFEQEHSALAAIAETQESVYQGVTLRCTHSYRCLQSRAHKHSSVQQPQMSQQHDLFPQYPQFSHIHSQPPSHHQQLFSPSPSISHQQYIHRQSPATYSPPAIPIPQNSIGYPSNSSSFLDNSFAQLSLSSAPQLAPSLFPSSFSSKALSTPSSSSSASSSQPATARSSFEENRENSSSNGNSLLDSLIDEYPSETHFSAANSFGENSFDLSNTHGQHKNDLSVNEKTHWAPPGLGLLSRD